MTINAVFPIVETRRLKLTPFTSTHINSKYVSWLNDPEVTQYSEQRHYCHSMSSCEEFWHTFRNTPHHFWAIECPQRDSHHIGNMIALVDSPNRVAELSIMIGDKSAWHQGYGREAWQGACHALLKEAGIRKVCAGTMADNTPMLEVMRAAGMVEEGRRIRHFIRDNRQVDLIQMALFSGEFRQP